MSNRRRVRLIALVGVVAAIGVGCGTAAVASSGGAVLRTAKAPLPSPQKPSKLQGKLTFWHYFSNAGPLNAMNAGIARFKKAYPNVKLQVETFPYEQFTNKVAQSAAAKIGPDIMFYNWADQNTLIKAGAIRPFDALFKAWPGNTKVPKAGVNRINGKIYSVRPYANLITLWYNADILNELGVQPPKTLSQMESIMQKAKAAGYNGITSGFNSPLLGYWTGMPYMFAECNGFKMSNAANVRAGLARPVRWVQNGYMGKDVTTIDQSGATAQFKTGKYAFATIGNWDMTTATEDLSFKAGNVPFPGAKCGGRVFVSGEGFSLGTFANKNPRLAMEFARLALLEAPAQQNFLTLAGSIPGDPALFKSPAVQKNPLLRAYLSASQTAISTAGTSGLNNAQMFFGEVFTGVLSGDVSIDDAVSRLVKETPGIIAKG